MDGAKRKRLEAAGWKLGDAAELLGLSAAESELVEIKLGLADALKRRREHARLTQAEAARRLGSSQSRVAKMEAGDRSVSLDLLVRSNLALGASRRDIARADARPGPHTARLTSCSREQPIRECPREHETKLLT